MIEIAPAQIPDIRARLKSASAELGDAWAQMESIEVQPRRQQAPFVQLAHDELPGEEIDAILAYEGIPQFNGAIGIPFPSRPVQLGKKELLVFPIDGLREHLSLHEPDLVARLQKSGGMSGYIAAQQGEISAREYLIGGLLECINYCVENRQALEIKW